MRLLMAALASAVCTAHAARPFVTDDARVVDPGGCHIEIFFTSGSANSASTNSVGGQWATPFDRRFGTIGMRVLWQR